MKLTRTLTAALLSMTMLTGITYAATPANTLVIADALDDIITLDPGEVGEVGGIMAAKQIYQTLIAPDVKDPTKIYGVLAESWSVSEDGKTFTFKMNPAAKFASGNPVTAHDAEYSLRRVVKMASRSAFLLTQLGLSAENVEERIKATDDATLVFEIGEPYAESFVLYALSSHSGGIVDSKLVMENEVDGDMGNAWLKQANSAGSGPYVLGTWTPKQSIMLNRNENFWQEAPAMERIFFQHVPESAAQRLLLEKGDIDIANKLGADDHNSIAGNPDVKTLDGSSGVIYYFGLNVRNEALSKPDFVKAMKYLVDYEGIEQTIGQGTIKTHQTFVPEGFLGAIDHNPYSLDIEKAKELIAASGVQTPVKLDAVVWNTPPYTDFAQAAQATMAQAGVELNLLVVDGQQWLERYRSADLDIWVGLWGPDYPDPHSNAKAFAVNSEDTPDGSTSLADRFGWDAGDISPRTMAALRENDNEKRRQMYEEIQLEHTDISPFLYMFQEVRRVAVRANVENLELGLTLSDDRYWKATKN
jgi:peptide/nickel transport system substrate-binding protein